GTHTTPYAGGQRTADLLCLRKEKRGGACGDFPGRKGVGHPPASVPEPLPGDGDRHVSHTLRTQDDHRHHYHAPEDAGTGCARFRDAISEALGDHSHDSADQTDCALEANAAHRSSRSTGRSRPCAPPGIRLSTDDRVWSRLGCIGDDLNEVCRPKRPTGSRRSSAPRHPYPPYDDSDGRLGPWYPRTAKRPAESRHSVTVCSPS